MSSSMRAKMVLQSVLRSNSAEQLAFVAVPKSGSYPEDGSDEDNTYAKYSPQATLNITVMNPNLFGKFNPGEKYYVDFTPAA